MLTASSSVTNLPVTISSSDPIVAAITNNGGNILLVSTGTGTVTLTATQLGNANVSTATPVSQPVVITPGAQTITFPAITSNAITQITVPGDNPRPIVIGGSNTVVTIGTSGSTNVIGTLAYAPGLQIALTATSSAGLPVSFASSSTNAPVSGSTLSVNGAGAVKITASQPGSPLWAAAKPVTQSLTIAKAPQTITLSLPSAVAYTNGGMIPLTGTASSGLPVAYKSGNTKVLSVAGTNCMILGKGSATIIATQPGGANYLPATPVTNTITVQ